MNFKKYNKIIYADAYVIEKIVSSGIDINDWVALEKVHGANFSFFIEDGVYKPACRSRFLDNPGEFYSSNRAIEHTLPQLLRVMELLDDKKVRLAGELFGGTYPKAEKVRAASRVQKGVFYHPDNLFYLFDIAIDDKWLPHDEVVDIGHECGFIVADPLSRGRLLDLINLNVEFQTTLPGRFGLPEIEDNIAEGYVFKPNVPAFFRSGKRVILKVKNERFREKQRKKKDRKPVPTIEMLDDDVKALYSKLNEYVTEQRLDNLLSHGYKYDNFGKAQGAFVSDMLEEAKNDEGITINDLNKKERKIVMKQIMRDVANLMRPRVNEIIGVLQ